MNSYYTGKHAAQYNRIWKTFLQKTLSAAYSAIAVEALQRDAQARSVPLRLLDAACGTGLLLKRLGLLFPTAELYGVDASVDMLTQAAHLLQGKPNVHLVQAKLIGGVTAGLPYPPAFFDLIVCTNALHYLQEPAAVLRGFRDLLVEQGQLVLEDYMLRGDPWLWKVLEWAIRLYDPEHRALFSREGVQCLCQQACLQVLIAQSFPIGLCCQGWVVRAVPAR